MTQRQRAAHYAVVAVIVGASYCIGVERVLFHPDESQWIATSCYLEALLGERIDEIRSDIPRPLWGEGYVTLTQPPLARYVIGVGRRLGGFGVADLNGMWNFHVDAQANEAAGNIPGTRLLLWSRLPMAILSIATGLLFFSIAWRCAGLMGGYVFALGFAFNPYLLQILRRAMSEATLTFFAVLVLVAAEGAVRAFRTVDLRDTPLRENIRLSAWWLAAGLCCGLAGAAKLNGLLMAGGAAFAAWVAAHCVAGESPPMAQRCAAFVAIGIVLAATAVAFVAPNPYLYPDPARRTVHMGRSRVAGMKIQQAVYPEARLDGITDRARAAARRVFSQHAILQFPGARVVSGGFTLVGFLVLVRRALRSVKERRPGTEFVVVVLGASLVVPAILTPLDWDRYYLFPVLFAGLCLAVGVSAATELALTRTASST